MKSFASGLGRSVSMSAVAVLAPMISAMAGVGMPLALPEGSAGDLGEPPAATTSLRVGDTEVAVTGTGFAVSVGTGWGLELSEWGREDAPIALRQSGIASRGSGGRIEITHPGITAWYVPGDGGVEQGFTIPERPAGDGRLVVTQTPRGGLVPLVDRDGTGLTWLSLTGRAVGSYSGLLVTDAAGAELPARIEVTRSGDVRIAIDDAAARYPVTIDPTITQYQKIASDETPDAAGKLFGFSVDVSGDTLVAGAPFAGDYAGEAYVFERTGALSWGLVTALPKTGGDGFFGYTVAIDGDTIAIGAPGYQEPVNNFFYQDGAVFLYERQPSGDWEYDRGFTRETVDPSEPLQFSFGAAMDLDGDTLVVGVRHKTWVYERDEGGPGEWGLAALVRDENSNHYHGIAVAVSGDLAVVGAPAAAAFLGDGVGNVFILDRNVPGVDFPRWGVVKQLDGPQEEDLFGAALAIDGNTLVVGVPLADPNSVIENGGAARVYVRNLGGPNNWGLEAVLLPSVSEAHERFGSAVAIDGDTVAVGTPEDDGTGAVYVYDRQRTIPIEWNQTARLQPDPDDAETRFGRSVAIHLDTLVVGSPFDDDVGVDSGSAHVFLRDQGGTDAWGEATELHATDPTVGDGFGTSVAVSGNTLAIGRPGDDTVGADAGQVQIFERNLNAGGNWALAATLQPPEPTGTGRMGSAVALDGDTLVVGEPGAHNGVGLCRVYERDEGGPDSWGQVGTLQGDGGVEEAFGSAVALQVNTIVVGAPFDEDQGPESGSVYVYDRNSGGVNAWGRVQKLTVGLSGPNRFGTSVALDGVTMAVGRPQSSIGGLHSGAVNVHARAGAPDTWALETVIDSSDSMAHDALGASLDLDGDTLIVGAPGADPSGQFQAGAAYVFERNLGGAGNWGQRAKLVAADGAAFEELGFDVAIEGNTAVVGSPFDNPISEAEGSMYVFDRNLGGPGAWGQYAEMIAVDPYEFGRFGWALSLAGEVLAVGAPGADAIGAVYLHDVPHGALSLDGLGPSHVVQGETFGIALTAANDGPSPVSEMTIHDILPAELELVRAIPSADGVCSEPESGFVKCTWPGASAPGAEQTVDLELTVDPATPAGTVVDHNATLLADDIFNVAEHTLSFTVTDPTPTPTPTPSPTPTETPKFEPTPTETPEKPKATATPTPTPTPGTTATPTLTPGPLVTFVVDTTADGGDCFPADAFCEACGGGCTFRAAVQESNALPGANRIEFGIGGESLYTIDLGAEPVTVTDTLEIDGTRIPPCGEEAIIEIVSDAPTTLVVQGDTTICGIVLR